MKNQAKFLNYSSRKKDPLLTTEEVIVYAKQKTTQAINALVMLEFMDDLPKSNVG